VLDTFAFAKERRSEYHLHSAEISQCLELNGIWVQQCYYIV